MSPEENKAIVGRLFEALNTGDSAALDELVASDCQITGPAGSGQGPVVYKQVFELLRTAFPDVYVTVEEMLAAEGDRVIVRTRTAGTHQGSFMGIAPTNKPVTWAGV